MSMESLIVQASSQIIAASLFLLFLAPHLYDLFQLPRRLPEQSGSRFLESAKIEFMSYR